MHTGFPVMLHENIFRPIHKTWLNFEFSACSFDYTLESFFLLGNWRIFWKDPIGCYPSFPSSLRVLEPLLFTTALLQNCAIYHSCNPIN